MPALVDEKFREWTAGLDAKDARVSIFEHIRDIPYSLAVPMTAPGTAPEQILVRGKGNCGPKHYLLADMYRRLGYEVVYATFPFLWNDPDILYPSDLRNLAAALPVAHHLACRIRIDDRWILVDATWDLPLASGGFPVTLHWNGRADTLCAVKPLHSAVRTAFCRTATNELYRDRSEKIKDHLEGDHDLEDVRGHARYYRKNVSVRTPEEIQRIHRFNHEFDAWLESLRKGS